MLTPIQDSGVARSFNKYCEWLIDGRTLSYCRDVLCTVYATTPHVKCQTPVNNTLTPPLPFHLNNPTFASFSFQRALDSSL